MEGLPSIAALRRVVARALEAAERGDVGWQLHVEGASFALENAATAARAQSRWTDNDFRVAKRLQELATAMSGAAAELRGVLDVDDVAAAEGVRRALTVLDDVPSSSA